MANIRTMNMSDSDIVTYHLFSIYIGHKWNTTKEQKKYDEMEDEDEKREQEIKTGQTQKYKATKIVKRLLCETNSIIND